MVSQLNRARISFVDLVTPHSELQDELLAAFRAVLRSGTFLGGLIVEDFEREFAHYCDTRYCAGISSGVDALRIALIAAGVRPGDIVLTAPNTGVATAEAICKAGARPDFVDVDERTYNMEPMKLEKYLETRCHMDSVTGKLFHLFGQPADMDPILEISELYHLIVIEDVCQAHGAEYFSTKENRWRKAGSVGHAAAFSFYPRANLGACGKAGAVTTNDAALAQEVRKVRDHSHTLHGNLEISDCQLDAIQAGILQVKLGHLSEWTKKCRENAFCYHGLLASVVNAGITIPYEPSWARATYQSYVIRSKNRDELQSYLLAANIVTEIHDPLHLHPQGCDQDVCYQFEDFPATEKLASEVLSLPMYPQLEFDQQYRIAQKVSEFVGRAKVSECRSHSLPLSPA